MTTTVTLQPSGHTFPTEQNESILDAALQAGLHLDYRCSNGTCGQCKGRLISGEVQKLSFHDYILSEAEKTKGYTLLCSYAASTDVVIEANEASSVGDIPIQEVQAKVRRIEKLNNNIINLHIRTPRSRSLRFMAGQEVSLRIADLRARMVSIASCPCDSMNLQFHFKREPDDAFIEYVFNQLSLSDEVIIKGPYGNFTLDEDSSRPLVFISRDLGIAPVKSLIEHALSLNDDRIIHLYWLSSSEQGHYINNYFRSLADALENFFYRPLTVNNDQPETGQISAMITNELSSLENQDFYLCAREICLTEFKDYLTTAGVPLRQIHERVLEENSE